MKLHFEIIPPDIYANANQEQDFFAVVENNQWKQADRNHVINEIEKGTGQPSQMRVIGLNVKPNRVRKVEKLGKLEKTDFPDYSVPVMLHYEGGTLKITAYEGSSIVWKKSLTYQLPGKYFPKTKMSSKWKQVDDQRAICQLKLDEIIAEEWSYIGPIHHYIRFTDDYSIAIDLGIQMAVNSQTFEPMTYYIDRVYSLKNITLYLNQSLIPTESKPQKSPLTIREESETCEAPIVEERKKIKITAKTLHKCNHEHK